MQSICFNVGTVKVLAHAYPENKAINAAIKRLNIPCEPLPLIYAHYFDARTWPDGEQLAPTDRCGSITNVVGTLRWRIAIQTIGVES